MSVILSEAKDLVFNSDQARILRRLAPQKQRDLVLGMTIKVLSAQFILLLDFALALGLVLPFTVDC